VLPIGAHVPSGNPLLEADKRGADLAQFFLADPQGWQAPAPHPEAAALRAGGLPLYVHAPYVINVATTNNRIRIPSRKLLSQHAAAAAEIGAAGLIVHGGHVNAGDDPAVGCDNWRKTFQRAEFGLPVLIENTAGGERAMARRLDALARLWDALAGFDVGFCLDTCHAHAGGEELAGLVDRVLAITGRIDLVHANDSRDAFGSGADRHQNLGAGRIDPAALVEVVRAAGAPALVETPGGVEEHTADIGFLRERLGPQRRQSTQMPDVNATTNTAISGAQVQT
jgi:deoxyribonuclease-4